VKWRFGVALTSLGASTVTLRRARLVLGWVTVLSPAVCKQPPRPIQPPALSVTGNEYRPKCGDALWLGCKCRMAHSFHGYTCGWQVQISDYLLTRAMPESFRDEYRTHYRSLYKCHVYFQLPSFLGWSQCSVRFPSVL